MSKKVDSSMLTCHYVGDKPNGTREFWIRHNGSPVAIGKVPGPGLTGTIDAQNSDYLLASREYLKKNFPEYNWK